MWETFPRLIRPIWRTFAIKRVNARLTKRIKETLVFQLDEYPSLFFVKIYLTADVMEVWKKERRILFPKKCCVCFDDMDFTLSSYQSIRFSGGQKTKSVLNAVPHCGHHGREGSCQLVVDVETENDFLTSILLCGRNAEFLEATVLINKVGDTFPPWKAFPHRANLVHGWNQGLEEIWWDYVWDPFWRGTGEMNRVIYLAKWSPSKEWREQLLKYPVGNAPWT